MNEWITSYVPSTTCRLLNWVQPSNPVVFTCWGIPGPLSGKVFRPFCTSTKRRFSFITAMPRTLSPWEESSVMSPVSRSFFTKRALRLELSATYNALSGGHDQKTKLQSKVAKGDAIKPKWYNVWGAIHSNCRCIIYCYFKKNSSPKVRNPFNNIFNCVTRWTFKYINTQIWWIFTCLTPVEPAIWPSIFSYSGKTVLRR